MSSCSNSPVGDNAIIYWWCLRRMAPWGSARLRAVPIHDIKPNQDGAVVPLNVHKVRFNGHQYRVIIVEILHGTVLKDLRLELQGDDIRFTVRREKIGEEQARSLGLLLQEERDLLKGTSAVVQEAPIEPADCRNDGFVALREDSNPGAESRQQKRNRKNRPARPAPYPEYPPSVTTSLALPQSSFGHDGTVPSPTTSSALDTNLVTNVRHEFSEEHRVGSDMSDRNVAYFSDEPSLQRPFLLDTPGQFDFNPHGIGQPLVAPEVFQRHHHDVVSYNQSPRSLIDAAPLHAMADHPGVHHGYQLDLRDPSGLPPRDYSYQIQPVEPDAYHQASSFRRPSSRESSLVQPVMPVLKRRFRHPAEYSPFLYGSRQVEPPFYLPNDRSYHASRRNAQSSREGWNDGGARSRNRRVAR